MRMNFEGQYEIRSWDGRIGLYTSSFKPDRGSVLHSGIFNKELASSFLAATVIISYLIITAMFGELRLVHFIVASLIFIVIFPISRVYVFKEPKLATEIDKGTGTVTLTLRKPLGSRTVMKPLGSLRDITVEHLRIEPENPDGIAVVEKIALQHGTVIPGFGEIAEFYNVVLDFTDDKYSIFTTKVESEARTAAERLKKYIG